MEAITVLLVDDNKIVREGLCALLKAEDGIWVVGAASNGRQAVALTRKLCPNVVVMDITMPVLNGLEATRQILLSAPATKVLMLSSHSDDAYIEQSMALGASGYLIKQTDWHILPQAIREVHQGKTFFSPSVSKNLGHTRRNPVGRRRSVSRA